MSVSKVTVLSSSSCNGILTGSGRGDADERGDSSEIKLGIRM